MIQIIWLKVSISLYQISDIMIRDGYIQIFFFKKDKTFFSHGKALC